MYTEVISDKRVVEGRDENFQKINFIVYKIAQNNFSVM